VSRGSLLLVVLALAAVPAATGAPSASHPVLLFERSSGDDCVADLFVIDADGAHLRRLTFDTFLPPEQRRRSPFTASFGGRWSPDGTKIVFTREQAFGDCSHPDTRDDVFLMDALGSHVHPLTSYGASGGASVSHDGARLVFGSGGSVVVSDPGARRRRVIGNGGFARWSPDGSKIAYDCGVSRTQVCVADLRTKRTLPLGANIYTYSVHRPWRRRNCPHWSSDGSLIVFVKGGAIWVARPDGSGLRRLTSGRWSDSAPEWQPS
jgi:Tol biopolymer transport system component